MTHIVHHTGLESSGGATRVARLLMDGLSSQGFASGLTFELAERDDSTAILPDMFGRQLADGAISHVHCTGNWPALLASIPDGRKTVITLHDCELFTGGCPYPLDCPEVGTGCGTPCPRNFEDSSEVRKFKLHQIQRLSPLLVAPSRWLARMAKSHLFLPVTIIPNGIPWPERPLRKREARRQLGINPTARVMVFAAHGGTNAAYKSGQEWRSIWQRIKAKLPESLCFAVGGDTAGREGDLVIWPYVERDRLSLLMAAADVLLYPTRADNHSLVILEAMAQALPVVAYGVGGVPEQVEDRKTGRLIPAGQIDLFIQVAVELLGDQTMCRDLGQAAFSLGRRRFAVERMVADYIKLYRQIL